MKASEPKWANPVLNNLGVSSLRFGGLHLLLGFLKSYQKHKLLHFYISKFDYSLIFKALKVKKGEKSILIQKPKPLPISCLFHL